MHVIRTTTAWDLIGFADEDAYLRIVGGRTLYEDAVYYDDTPGEHVKLAYLKSTPDGIRQVNRWVHPDTLIEVVRKD